MSCGATGCVSGAGRTHRHGWQIARVKDLKVSDPSAKDVHRHVLHVVVADIDNAVEAFVRRVKAGEKTGYPRFKGRTRFDSFG